MLPESFSPMNLAISSNWSGDLMAKYIRLKLFSHTSLLEALNKEIVRPWWPAKVLPALIASQFISISPSEWSDAQGS